MHPNRSAPRCLPCGYQDPLHAPNGTSAHVPAGSYKAPEVSHPCSHPGGLGGWGEDAMPACTIPCHAPPHPTYPGPPHPVTPPHPHYPTPPPHYPTPPHHTTPPLPYPTPPDHPTPPHPIPPNPTPPHPTTPHPTPPHPPYCTPPTHTISQSFPVHAGLPLYLGRCVQGGRQPGLLGGRLPVAQICTPRMVVL